MSLDKTIKEWFDAQPVKDYKLIEYNGWKGRYCLFYLTNKGERRFLKWNKHLTETQKHHEQLLKKEKHIYQQLKGLGITPQYIDDDLMFITEFVDGRTLRNTIKSLEESGDSDRIYQIVTETLKKWKAFVNALSDSYDVYHNMVRLQDDFNKFLGTLLLSGPFETKCLNKLEWIKNLVIYRCLKMIAGLTLKKVLKEKCTMSIIHGDLHANNLLVAADKVFLVDLENVRWGGQKLN